MSNIVKVSDFTTIPGARHRSDGDGSADEFFEDYIVPTLKSMPKNKRHIVIDFDGTWGYASSFISQLALRFLQKYKTVEIVRSVVDIETTEQPGLEQRFWDEVEELYDSQEF